MLRVSELVKTFPGSARDGSPVAAVDGLTLDVEPGKFFTVLGPSGCGKTTLLRCVAGLERPDSGEIAVAGSVFFSSRARVAVPAQERGLGMVFQSYAVWPHMKVADTVAFPLAVRPRRIRPGKRERRERVDRALSVVRLEHLADRRPGDLSGGEQQRVALARALVMEPPLLLMDEPLSNLDAQLREDMRFELKRLQRELGVTTVYVTHDQAEALGLSNRIAVMRAGRIEQVGKPRQVYQHPTSRFVAEFMGGSNVIEGVVERGGPDGGCQVATSLGTVHARSANGFGAGAKVVVVVRADQVSVRPAEGADPAPNRWTGTVHARAFRGETYDHVVKVGPLELLTRSDTSLSIRPGTGVLVTVPEHACMLLDPSP